MLILIALIAAHFFFDYAGQGDFMAKAKNRTAPLPGVSFWHPLTAHAFIHGAAVAIITGVWWLLLPEAILHWLIDDAKCRERISYTTDQAIHVVAKVVWWGVALAVVN